MSVSIAGHVGTQGLWGDRGWAIRDEATGEIHNAKRHPILMQCSAVYRAEPRVDHIPHVDITLPDGATVSSDSPAVSQRLSELMGRRVILRLLQPAADTAYYRRREPGSALLGRLAQYRLARRLKGELPTIRCAMPMHAQADLPRDPSVLRTIVREANQCLGLYASVIEAGRVGMGDPVERVPGAASQGLAK